MAPRSVEQNKEQREQSRMQILQAALKAFAEKGYTAASISYIAREAGVSKGLTYHYFDSKEDLLKGIFEMMIQRGEQLQKGWESKSPKAQLRQLIEGSIQFMQQQNEVMRFLISLAVQPAVIQNLHPLISAEKEKMIGRYCRAFSELGYQQPEIEAYYMGAVLDGLAVGYISLREEYPLEELKQKLLNKYRL